MRASLLLLSLIALVGTASAQFTSSFENWTDTVPSDWMGSKTTLSADSVEKVSTNAHSGSFAVRLSNSPSGHKRFTTQSITVVDGTTYDVTYWVRGAGSVRSGLYDGRAASSGYSSYTAYYVSTGDTWTQVTQQVTAANDTTGAQFILSIQLTSGAEDLVIDDVNVSAGVIVPPVEASIYEIQYSTAPDAASPLANQSVITGGIVTGVDTIGANSYFIQNGTGPWTGVYVFDAASVVAIGDSVTLQATVQEYQGATELVNVTNLVVVGQYALPAPAALNPTTAADEQWEGVLVKILDVECLNLPDFANFNQWNAANWQGATIVDDLMYLYAPTVGTFYSVTGVMHWANSERKIEPRQLSDIELGVGIGEFAGSTVAVFPNPANTTVSVNIPGINGRTEYTLTDATGRIVGGNVLTAELSTIDVSTMASGIYALTLRNGASVWSTRLVVKR